MNDPQLQKAPQFEVEVLPYAEPKPEINVKPQINLAPAPEGPPQPEPVYDDEPETKTQTKPKVELQTAPKVQEQERETATKPQPQAAPRRSWRLPEPGAVPQSRPTRGPTVPDYSPYDAGRGIEGIISDFAGAFTLGIEDEINNRPDVRTEPDAFGEYREEGPIGQFYEAGRNTIAYPRDAFNNAIDTIQDGIRNAPRINPREWTLPEFDIPPFEFPFPEIGPLPFPFPNPFPQPSPNNQPSPNPSPSPSPRPQPQPNPQPTPTPQNDREPFEQEDNDAEDRNDENQPQPSTEPIINFPDRFPDDRVCYHVISKHKYQKYSHQYQTYKDSDGVTRTLKTSTHLNPDEPYSPGHAGYYYFRSDTIGDVFNVLNQPVATSPIIDFPGRHYNPGLEMGEGQGELTITANNLHYAAKDSRSSTTYLDIQAWTFYTGPFRGNRITNAIKQNLIDFLAEYDSFYSKQGQYSMMSICSGDQLPPSRNRRYPPEPPKPPRRRRKPPMSCCSCAEIAQIVNTALARLNYSVSVPVVSCEYNIVEKKWLPEINYITINVLAVNASQAESQANVYSQLAAVAYNECEAKNVHQILGVEEYPVSLPKSLLTRREGLISELTPDVIERLYPDEQTEIHNLPRLITWFVEQFDALMGEWEVPLEIKDIDTTKQGDQPISMRIPNLAEYAAESMGILLELTTDMKTLINICFKTLAESGQDKQQNFKSYKLVETIADFLGFKYKEKGVEMPLLFTPGKTKIVDILQETVLNVPVAEYDEKSNFQMELMRIRKMAAILDAQFFRKIDPSGDVGKQVMKYLREGAESAEEMTEKEDDNFEQFIDDAQIGFINTPGITDRANPYGQPFENRPRIKNLGKLNQE